MATLTQIKQRLAEYLALEDTDPQFVQVIKSFEPKREQLLQAFPFLGLMYGMSEAEGAEHSAKVLEAVLFEIWWVDRFIGDRECVSSCRRKIETLLSLLVDDSYHYTHDPNLSIWVVIRALVVERTARSGGLTKLLRSREIEMLERVIADCQQHVTDHRPLPRDLPTRLRALESQGVIFPSDIYPVLEVLEK